MSQISVCSHCSSIMIHTKAFSEGLFEKHTFFCEHCQNNFVVNNSSADLIRYNTSKGRGYKEINVLTNVAVNSTGLTYKNYSDFFHMIGLSVSPKSGFHSLSELVWQEATAVAQQNFLSVLQMLKDNDSYELIFCSDGAWAHRGWTFGQGCYVV